jgi:hypothetical protein
MLEFWIYIHNSRLHFRAVLQSYSISSILVFTYSSRVCTLQVLYSPTIYLVSLCQTRCLSTSPSCSQLFNRRRATASSVSVHVRGAAVQSTGGHLQWKNTESLQSTCLHFEQATHSFWKAMMLRPEPWLLSAHLYS